MSQEMIDDELSQMYEEVEKVRVLDSSTFKKPIKQLRVKKPVTVAPAQSVAEVVKLMQKKRSGCVLVVEMGKLVGIFTERDVLMKVVGRTDLEAITIQEVMTPSPQAFQAEDSVAFILNAMHVGGYRHVPVLDENKNPVAVVSVKDIVSFMLEHFPEDVLNLPPEPIRKTEQREGA